ncbi:hypothetical protein [Enterococcus sp. AZ192]|uniref:hypothetical protein n=1 Tax=unclassified Enterococcus TaxID=2608891 RepID=UPI003D2948A7
MENKVQEILIYKLKENTGHEFHKIMTEESAPLHKRKGLKIIYCGKSLHDVDSYCLIREFDSLEQLERSQEKFYSDDDWINGPREKIVSLMVSSNRFISKKGFMS